MSVSIWLQNLYSALAPLRTNRCPRRRSYPLTRKHPSLERLEVRLTPSLTWGGDYLSSEWDRSATYDPIQVTADFNADGRLDFFQVQGGWADSDWMVEPVWITYETVLLGRADGTFQQADTWVVDWEPDFIGTGDFNGDDRPDVVIRNGDWYSVMLNDGNWGPPST